MNENLIYQLLKIIEYNGNILEITNQGFEFGQVSLFLETLNSQEYVTFTEDFKMMVSDIGKSFVKAFESNNNIRNYSQWVLPRTEMWSEPIGRFDIYIPKMVVRGSLTQ